MAAAWAALADARRYHGSCPLRARAASVDAARRAGHCSLSQCRFPLLLKAFRWKESVALRARPARSSSRKGAKAGRVTCLSRVRRGTRGRQRDVNLHELPRGHDGYPCFRVHGALRPEPAACVLRLYACARHSCALAPCIPPCALQHSTRVRRGSGDCFLKSPLSGGEQVKRRHLSRSISGSGTTIWPGFCPPAAAAPLRPRRGLDLQAVQC